MKTSGITIIVFLRAARGFLFDRKIPWFGGALPPAEAGANYMVATRRRCWIRLFMVIIGFGAILAVQSIAVGALSLLPSPWALKSLWPDLAAVQRNPRAFPAGYTPVYRRRDWKRYEHDFGAAVTASGHVGGAQDRLVLAQRLLAQATAKARGGLRRLLCLRAFALSFHYRAGSAIARQAQALYLGSITLSNPVQVASLWRMSNELAYPYVPTPPADRLRCDKLAEASNVQLVLDLLAIGQINAAEQVVKQLGVHETRGVRADAPLMAAMATARVLVRQTREMLAYLAARCPRVAKDPRAALDVYLYARFVLPRPGLGAAMVHCWPHGTAALLEHYLRASPTHPAAAFRAARLLARIGSALPPGILHDRVLFAALRLYRGFLADPTTASERIQQTLARIAVGQLIGQGARPTPRLAPLAEFLTPSTHPARPAAP